MWELYIERNEGTMRGLLGSCVWVNRLPKGRHTRLPPTRLGPPGFPAAKLKYTRSGDAWAMVPEDIWLLCVLFPPVAKAACVTRQQGPGKRTQDKIPWSQHLPMYFSFTFMVSVFCVGERVCVQGKHLCVYMPQVCGDQRTTWRNSLSLFHMGSRDWTQVIGHSTLLEWAELYFLWVNNF